MKKEISDLAVGDKAFMFGGYRGPAEGAEVVVSRVGRIYLYACSPGREGDKRGEYRFDRERGIEDANSNHRRYLVLDKETFLERRRCSAIHLKLRRNLGFEPAPGVTAADVEAAAALLRVDLKAVK